LPMGPPLWYDILSVWVIEYGSEMWSLYETAKLHPHANLTGASTYSWTSERRPCRAGH
jgi:hypothetical protein